MKSPSERRRIIMSSRAEVATMSLHALRWVWGTPTSKQTTTTTTTTTTASHPEGSLEGFAITTSNAQGSGDAESEWGAPHNLIAEEAA